MATAVREIWPVSIDSSAWKALTASGLGWMFDGYENYALILAMAPAVRQLLPREAANVTFYMGGLLTATLLGWAVGGIVAGVLTDYVGRRRMLMLSICWYAIFAGLTALSWDYWSFFACRLLTGLGLGAEWGPGAAIVAEFWPPSSRGRAAGVLHSSFGIGIFLASGIWELLSAQGPSSWRYMFAIGVLPAFVLLYARRGVQEPALWLTSNRNRRQARHRLEIGNSSELDEELNQFTMTRILSDPGLRRRVGLLLLMSISSVVGWWSGSTWIPQYAAEWTAKTGQAVLLSPSLTASLFGVGAIAGYIALGFLADMVGRKPVIWLYYLGALILSLSLFLLANTRSALLILAAANGFFASGQFSWMTIYLPEQIGRAHV